MSVGKESIKRAASAGTKKSTVDALAEEVKAAAATAETKAPPAAKPAAKKTARAKAASTRKTTAAKAAKTVKTSVLTPANAEEIQSKFISDKAKKSENVSGPVRITDELPVYLL